MIDEQKLHCHTRGCENVIRIARQSDRRESYQQESRGANAIPIRPVNSRGSFTARVKREAADGERISILPAMEMTKSSQQIQFTPELGYFYGTPESLDTQSMSDLGQFSQVQQVYANAFTPGYWPFQSNGQIACFQNQENAYPLFYCTFMPVQQSPMTYQFPANPDFKHRRECPLNHYICSDGSKCIPKFKWCDNKIDCPDSSDERTCSCRERLDSKRYCDNYLDCPNGEDELGCFGCPKTSFSCHDSIGGKPSNCFTLEDYCDGNNTCVNLKDEEDCSVLTRSYAATSLGLFPAGSLYGFLQRNWKGRWYHVCSKANHWASEACLAKLGFLSRQPEQEMVDASNHQDFGPFLLQDGRIIQECPKEILFVRCPDAGRVNNSRSRDDQTTTSDDRSLQALNSSNSDNPLVSIVGGRPSRAGAWPFIVAINKNGWFHCGGAVVNPYWILSAAHCFSGAQHSYFEIEAGSLRRHSFSPARQIRRVTQVIIHQHFNSQLLIYDVALVRLNEPLDFNEWVSSVNLPASVSFSGWNMEPSPGASCVALGWGALVEGGPDPDHLQEVEVPIVPCKHFPDRNAAEICAGYKLGGRDACQGDSGGPLMCRDSNLEWYIGGVVSHGIGCARVNEPGAYTKVSYFVDWINDIINDRTKLSTAFHPSDKCPGFVCHPPFNRCIPGKKQCDGIVDCLEAEDERNCPRSMTQSATHFLKGLFTHHKREVEQERSEV
ncbi:serine protease nudel-like [Phymastichus coffea]|uniref:serine protease nudel-like n=1 Tax=Phymastichus coffea TaxID=108790 RepID=UPI00273C246D|nr:serine protease nudel-like [Phymastichus coffea]